MEEQFRCEKDCFGLDESQVRLYTAIARHTVPVMAAAAICAITAALHKPGTGAQAPLAVRPGQPLPADPGVIALTVPEITRPACRLGGPAPTARSCRALADLERRHQALARWYPHRTGLARNANIALVTK